MPKIHFDPIDSKDGYGVLGTELGHTGEKTLNNITIIHMARREYLNKLEELQNNIREIFEPRLDEITDENKLEVNDARDFQDNLDKRLPLPRRGYLYYT